MRMDSEKEKEKEQWHEWKKDIKNGKGYHLFVDDLKYEGIWKNSMHYREGRNDQTRKLIKEGNYVHKKGDIYEGN